MDFSSTKSSEKIICLTETIRLQSLFVTLGNYSNATIKPSMNPTYLKASHYNKTTLNNIEDSNLDHNICCSDLCQN